MICNRLKFEKQGISLYEQLKTQYYIWIEKEIKANKARKFKQINILLANIFL